MEIWTMLTDFLPSWDGGRNYEARSITGGEIKDTNDASKKHIDNNIMVCQPEGRKFKKGIVKGSPFDGDKPRRIKLGLQNLLQRRKIEDGKDASKKYIDSPIIVCQPEGKKFKKGIVKGSPFDGDKPHCIKLGLQNLLQRRKIEDGKDASKKYIDSPIIVCQPEGKKFKKGIVKGSPFDGDKPRCIKLGLQNLLQRRKTEDGKDASKKYFNSLVTIYQLEGKKFEKRIVNGSSFDGSKTNNTASPAGREDPNLTCKPKVVTHNTKELSPRGYKFASRDLKSVSLLGKGFSGIVYETIWKKKLRCARKDFVRVPSAIFERETKMFVRLKDHSNVVKTFGWAVAKICCSLVLELMDCSLRSLAQRKKLMRQVKSSGPHIDSSTSTTMDSGLDSGCSNSPEIRLIPKQEIEKKMNDSNFPVRASSEAQTSSPFSILEVIQIITDIAAGVKYLHDNKVVHGDLKPGNILVNLEKRAGSSNSFDDSLTIKTVKVVDFGVIESKFMSRCMTSVSSETRELDRIRRKAPELFDIDHGLKQDFDALAMGDIYSFGTTASEILSGEEPYSDYQNSGVKTLRELILEGTRPELPDRCQQLNELIRRCWDCKPTKRPNFVSILEELEKIRAALSVEDKSRVAMRPTSDVLESSSLKRLDDQFNRVDHFLTRHSSLDILEIVN